MPTKLQAARQAGKMRTSRGTDKKKKLRARLEDIPSRSYAAGNKHDTATEARDHRQQKIIKLTLEQNQLP